MADESRDDRMMATTSEEDQLVETASAAAALPPTIHTIHGDNVSVIEQQTIFKGDQKILQVSGDNYQAETINVITGDKREDVETIAFDIQMVKEELMEQYRDTMAHLPLLPGMPEEFANMEDLFVDLEMLTEDKKPSGIIHKELKTYGDLVCIERGKEKKQGKEFVKHLLVRGEPGIGKTSTISKLAYDWACKKQDSPMTRFELVFVITINEIDTDTDLIGVIQDQLLPKVSKRGLEDYLQSNAGSVAFLFDGYDEATSYFDRCKDITNVLQSKWLAGACVIVTTRPNQVGKFCQKYGSSYVQIRIRGLSFDSRERYVSKFFQLRDENDRGDEHHHCADCDDDQPLHLHHDHDHDRSQENQDHNDNAKALLMRLYTSLCLLQLSTVPIILSMFCLIWTADAELPISVTALYKEVLLHLAKHKCAKTTAGDLNEIAIRHWVEYILLHVGERALICLLEDRLVFQDDEFDKQYLEEACNLGIVNTERKRSRTSITRKVTFLHKTFQEMCAATYFASLVERDVKMFRKHLEWIVSQNVFQMELFLRFACGSSKESEKILQHVAQIMFAEFQSARKKGEEEEGSWNSPFHKFLILLLFEVEMNVSMESGCKVHECVQPLFNYIKLDMREDFDSDLQFDRVMKYYIYTKRQTWLDVVKCIEIRLHYRDFDPEFMSYRYSSASLDFLCSMSSITTLRVKADMSLIYIFTPTGHGDLGYLFVVLMERQFTPITLTEIYLRGFSTDAQPFYKFLSSLPCLTKVDLYDTKVSGEVSDDVSLTGLKERSITMATGADGRYINGINPFSNLSRGMFGRPVIVEYYFSTPALVCKLFSSLPVLMKLKLVNVPLSGELRSSIVFPALKDLHIEGSGEMLSNILNGFTQIDNTPQNLTRSSVNPSCIPLESVFINDIHFDQTMKLAEIMPCMPHLRRLALPFEPYRSTYFRGLDTDRDELENSHISSLEPDDWVKIFDRFSGAMQKMRCSCEKVKNSDGQSVENIRYGTQLEEVDLCGNRLGHSVRNFAGTYRYMPRLKCLNLKCGVYSERMEPEDCEILFHAFIEAGLTHGKVGLPLEALDLSGNELGYSLHTFARVYVHTPHLRSLRLFGSNSLPYQSFHWMVFFDAFISAGKSTEHGLSLEVLDLTNNFISESVIPLTRALKYMTRLKELGCPKLLSSEYAVLFDWMVKAEKECKNGFITLEILKINGGYIGDSVGKLAHAYMYMTSLKVLELVDTKMNSTQCSVLFDGLLAAGKKATQLPGDSSQAHNVEEMSPPSGLKMERLILSGNDIGDSHDKLCEALGYMPCIKELDISGCELQKKQIATVNAVVKTTVPDYDSVHIRHDYKIPFHLFFHNMFS